MDPPFAHPDVIPGCGSPPVPPANSDPEFIPLHACLIPVGPHRGKLLVWDASGDNACGHVNGDWDQRWAIVDPLARTVSPFVVTIPAAAAPAPRNIPTGLPTQGGSNLFCAGHCWLPDGKLMVAGGDYWIKLPNTPSEPGFRGARIVCVYDPASGANGQWNFLPPLQYARWYPTLTLLGEVTMAPANPRVVISGGVEEWDNKSWDISAHSYEAYHTTSLLPDLRQGSGSLPAGVWEGPPVTAGDPTISLFLYPRMLQISERALGGALGGVTPDGRLFVAAFAPTRSSSQPLGGVTPDGRLFVVGMWPRTAHVDHPSVVPGPGVWPGPYPDQSAVAGIPNAKREEGAAVLFPDLSSSHQDKIMVLGGEIDDVVTNTVLFLDTKTAPPGVPAWQLGPPMLQARKFPNVVLLPDGAVGVFGGSATPCYGTQICHGHTHTTELPQKNPEIFKNGAWTLCSPEISARTYHSCAILLPSGRVMTCGGCTGTWEYQVFTPPNLVGRIGTSAQPQWSPPLSPSHPATPMSYNSQYSFAFQTLPVGVTLDRVVLMAPGSVTHSHDQSQRYVQLELGGDDSGTFTVTTPTNASYAPKGYYMMFMVASNGATSEARWVRLL